jgi:hypothetical protein
MLTITDPEFVVPWVYRRLDRIPPDQHLAQAIGFSRDGLSLVAGVTYHNWNLYNLDVAVAVVPGFEWTRRALRTCFAYPFEQLKATRITAHVPSDNFESQRFVERLGFTLEARLKHACKAGDLLLFRMTLAECKWLRNRSGKIFKTVCA